MTTLLTSTLKKRRRTTKERPNPASRRLVVEKESRCQDDSDEEESEQKESRRRIIRNKRRPEYSFIILHKRELMGLSEEQDTCDLGNGCLFGTSHSACEKIIASKCKLTVEESAIETILKNKWLLFSCEKFSTSKETPCSFCVHYQCYADASFKERKKMIMAIKGLDNLGGRSK